MVTEREMDEMWELARNYIRFERAEFKKMRLGDRNDGLRSNQGLVQGFGEEEAGEETDSILEEGSEPRLPETQETNSRTV